MLKPVSFDIPPIASGGLMLTYKCSSKCKHCVYRCSPRMPDEWISMEMAESIFRDLKMEPYFSGLHFAGGEATLNMGRLVEVIQLARDMDIPIDYLETNAYWCDTPADTERQFRRLKEAGLPCVMISASMYHNEFVPFKNTRIARDAARKVFGPDGYFVYPGHLFQALSLLPDDGRHRLDVFCEQMGITKDDPELYDLFPLIPSGRPLEALPQFFKQEPAAAYAGMTCAAQLQRPHHVHIDLYGNVFTGSCCGVSPAKVGNFHPDITPSETPIFYTLCSEGPHGLRRLAQSYGFKECEEGYRGKCDLCFKVRKYLCDSGDFPELSPACYYEN